MFSSVNSSYSLYYVIFAQDVVTLLQIFKSMSGPSSYEINYNDCLSAAFEVDGDYYDVTTGRW